MPPLELEPLEPELLLEAELALDALDALEAEEPPLDVEVEPPEVEVEPPEVEVELPVLPPVDVEVEPVDELEMTMLPPELELPPKKPPLKKPPPKPKPPLEPPTMIGTPPPPVLATATGGGGGGANIGGMIVRVTVWVGVAQEIRRTVRLTTRRWPDLTTRRTCVPAWAVRTICGRATGFSVTATAPPPMIAPPHVQAQSFAKAILTDIRHPVF